MMKRRGFMGGIMAALATTPDKVLKNAGVSPTPLGVSEGPFTDLVSGIRGADTAGGPVRDPWYVSQRLKLSALKTLRPDWFEKKRRHQARTVVALDIDLAALQSVSPAAKLAIMRERQYQRMLDEHIDHLSRLEADFGI